MTEDTPTRLREIEARRVAIAECRALLRKWFWSRNNDAKACDAEMAALAKDATP